VFKNPPGDHAGRLIDAAGLKGAREGGAEVSSLHANFIVTSPGATSADVMGLVARIQEEVRRRFGVSLEREVVLLSECLRAAP
jgi:UDP-N-acetylmuramate dehydrogenase